MDLDNEELKATKNKGKETITLNRDGKTIELLRTDIIDLYEQILAKSEKEEKTANEMFNELGYKKTNEIINEFIEYIKYPCGYDNMVRKTIVFDIKHKSLNIRTEYLLIHTELTTILSMQELKAIYKKCQEMGWI